MTDVPVLSIVDVAKVNTIARMSRGRPEERNPCLEACADTPVRNVMSSHDIKEKRNIYIHI